MKTNLVRTALATALALPSLAFFSNAASAGPADFVVYNMSNVPMVSLRVSSSHRSNWGRNLLGPSLNPGGSVRVNVNEPGCEHDIQATFANGNVVQRGNVNFCRIKRFNFNP
jgi:hypothetical protein